MIATCTSAIVNDVLVMGSNNSVGKAVFLDPLTLGANISNTVIPFRKHLPLFEMGKNFKTSETHV